MKINPGDLVKLVLANSVSPESLTLSPQRNDASLILYENIDLSTFPSFKDFKGYSKTFKNETLLVIKKKGRPKNFNSEKCWELYDVYQIMYCDLVFDCFKHCLEKIKN